MSNASRGVTFSPRSARTGNNPVHAMHPAVALICLLVFASGVAVGGMVAVVAGTLMILLLFLVTPPAVAPAWLMTQRVRWLLLSLLVAFAWFTPGTPVVTGMDSSLIPSREGLWLALERGLALLLMIAAVCILFQRCGREALVASLLWLLRPLARCGFPSERFAARLMLSLSAVASLQPALQEETRRLHKGKGGRLRAAGEGLSLLFERTLQEAERASLERLSLSPATRPPSWQWSLPLLLLALFLLLARL